jgi:hypothetical protein
MGAVDVALRVLPPWAHPWTRSCVRLVPRLGGSATPVARPIASRLSAGCTAGAAGVFVPRAACPVCGRVGWAPRQRKMGGCAHRDRGSQARCCSYSGACDPAVQPNGPFLPPVAATGLQAPLDSSEATEQAAAAGAAMRAPAARTPSWPAHSVIGARRRQRVRIGALHGSPCRAGGDTAAPAVGRSPEDKDRWAASPGQRDEAADDGPVCDVGAEADERCLGPVVAHEEAGRLEQGDGGRGGGRCSHARVD